MPKKNISKIGLALDLTTYSVKSAIKNKCELLICFHAPEALDKRLPLDKKITALIKNKLTIYKAHLRLNFCVDGTNDSLCKMCGFDAKPIKFIYQGKHKIIGGAYRIKGEYLLKEVLTKLRKIRSPFINIYNHHSKKKYKNILVSSGSGFKQEFIDQFKPDMVISGEAKHNAIYYAKEFGVTLVEATHWATETLPLEEVGKKISEKLNIPIYFIPQPLGVKTIVFEDV